MVACEVGYGNIGLAVKVGRIAVEPYALAVFRKLFSCNVIKYFKIAEGFLDTSCNRSYKLHLIFTEITGDVLVIAKGVSGLSKPAVAVNSQCFTLYSEFSAVIIFTHVFHLISQRTAQYNLLWVYLLKFRQA